MRRNIEEDAESNSVLFSSDDEISVQSSEGIDDASSESESSEFDEEEEEPFFPQIEDVFRSLSSNIHPWENEEQYQNRLLQEEEEDAAERAEREEEAAAAAASAAAAKLSSQNEDDDDYFDDLFSYGPTFMERELARLREQRDKVSPNPEVIEKFKGTVKRVRFDEKNYSEAMDVALKNLKEMEIAEIGSDKVTEEVDEAEGEAEVCLRCRHQIESEKQEKEYARWIRKSAEEGQMFLGNSLYEPCAAFQLAYLDEYLTAAEEVKQIEATFVEFVKLFYFVQWDKLMRPDNELMLKEVYHLWEDFRKKRHRVCDEHYRDFHFRFFTSSVAVKIKKTLFSMESLRTRQEATTLDWAHLKPCVVSVDDDTEHIERLMETEVEVDPKWTPSEQSAAKEYWNIFGTVPLHIVSKKNPGFAPDSVDSLEIIDDTNYWTKKMLRAVMYNRRNFDIKLTYTKKRKRDEMFFTQYKTQKVLQSRWKTRLDHMTNETPLFDFETTTLRIRAADNIIHTDDAHYPWPVCQIDDGESFVTIRPLITKRFRELKSRIRSKFNFVRQSVSTKHTRDHPITRSDIRKSQSYRRFEPKLKKSEELTAMLSKHFKVVDRQEITRRYKLYTIVEEDEEVDLLVALLEQQKEESKGRFVLDPETIFADRQELRLERETQILAKMKNDKFRKDVANTKKRDCAKMSLLKNHWVPDFKKTLKKAQKAMQLGSILVDEEIQKWMEYQYELSFVKKSFKKKLRITKAQMKRNAPLKWQEAIDQLDFNEPSLPPPYLRLPEKPSPESTSPSLPSFNSSSEDEEDEEKEESPEKKLGDYEKCVDLVAVAGKLQDEVEERIAMNDRDEDWEYSDDSSVSTWFNGECDDILNRLVNLDYVDEHIILKERSKGVLGKKLWEVMEERENEVAESDDDETSLEDIREKTRVMEDREDADFLEACQYLGDFGDVGVSDGKKTKELAEKESDMDLRNYDKKEIRNLEIQQLRYFFRQYKLDHSYTTEPFDWTIELQEPIAALHRNELRRVGNRVHKQMKKEYEAMVEQDEIIIQQFPADENSLHNKMFNYLMFGESGESFKDVSKKVNEANRMLKPLKKYEMFFGREGIVKLKRIKNEVMECMNIRSSIKYLCKEFGVKMELPKERLVAFLKLWWMNSAQTLRSFVSVCEEAYDVDDKIVDELIVWDELPQHLDIVRETIDQLEIGLMVNDILFVVEQYVEEIGTLDRCATLLDDKCGFSSMDVWDWHEIKYGYPYLYDDLGEARQKLLDSESEHCSDEEEENEGNIDNVPGETVDQEQNENEQEEEEIAAEDEEEEFLVPLSSPEEEEEEVSPIHLPNEEPTRRLSFPGASTEVIDRLESNPLSLHQQLMNHYKAVYEEVRLAEAEKKERKAEENARKLLEEWEGYEADQAWEADDIGRKIHDFLTMEQTIRENDRVFGSLKEENEVVKLTEVCKNWADELAKIERGEIDEPQVALYAKEDVTRYEMLEMCGLPVTLDHEMFMAEIDLCQSTSESISDASDLADAIEKGFEDDECEVLTTDIDADAQSYSSAKHVHKYELYFQREVQSRHLPSCVVIFSPKQFFEDPAEFDPNFKKWKRILEASDGPFTFNRLVMRERLLKRCRDEFASRLIENYFDVEDRKIQRVLDVFRRCLILCVVDTEMNPWTCRVVSNDSVAKPPNDRKSYIRKMVVEDSQRELIVWLKKNKIDMDVYSRCPVILDRGGPLSLNDANQMSNILIEDDVYEDWLSIKRDEGVCALDAIIKMPSPPKNKIAGYKAIFKPIYEAWYPMWKFHNERSVAKVQLKPKRDRVKEYIYKTRMIVNYAHQHYRMKKYDSLFAKDPTAYHTIDRADVPSASLFDSLDTAVTRFCDEDSPHLNEEDKKTLRDSLMQLATGKIPYFTTNYFGAKDYTEEHEPLSDSDDEDDKSQSQSESELIATRSDSKINVWDVESEYEWLRNMYEKTDMNRRRFMARLLFEIAQKAMYRFAPGLANFEGAQKKFEHLLTLHGKQRPLLDMMLTKVRGTYFMPLETNMFLYNHKLITFGELVESEIDPRDMRYHRFSLEKIRRQEPRSRQQMNDFLDGIIEDTDSDDSDCSDTSSDSSTLGSMESLDLLSKKGRRRARRYAARTRKEEMLLKLQSKPEDPDESFFIEKRALGPRAWRTRRKISSMLEGIADLDKNSIKLPVNKQGLLDHINKLIVENSETAHWSWGDLQMRTRINCIPPVHRMKQKHIDKIKKGLKMYQPPKKYDSNSKKEDGRKWF